MSRLTQSVLAAALGGATVTTVSLTASLTAAVVAAAVTPALAASQVGSTTDIVTGRVTNERGAPIEGAQVTATSVETGVSRSRATNAQGRYTILFPDGGGRYRVTVRAIGNQPRTINVQREGDEDRLVADVRLGQVATQLAEVRVQARAQQPAGGQFRPEPGNTERTVSTEQALRLPVDASDPNALAALTPGVIAQGGSDSTAAGFNVAGQRASQNNVTLDGLTFGGAGFPQEAVRGTRVITNTFDVARGQFSGGQVASTTRGGTNNLYVGSTYTLRAPQLQWRPDFAGAFGQGSTTNQLSAGVGGPIKRDKLFYFVTGQVQRRASPLQSLLGADPTALLLAGANPDSVSRFLGGVSALGVSATQPRIPSRQLNDNLFGLVRLDWNVTDEHTLTLRGDARLAEQDASRVGALAVPTFGGDTRNRGGGVLASLTSRFGRDVFGGAVINEGKVYATGQTNRGAPYLAVPASRVRVTSDLGDGVSGVSTLSFGGNPSLYNDDQTNYVEATDELSWQSPGGAHRVKLGGLLNASRYDQWTAFNRYGTYTFNSLDDFLAGRPALFTRSLVNRTNQGGALNLATYLGDTWRQSRNFQLTYGVRLERASYSGAPAQNPAVLQRFGLNTGRFPSETRLSPRVGFSYTFFPDTARQNREQSQRQQARGDRRAARAQQGGPGGFGRGGPTLFVRGGVGEFRGRAESPLFSAAQQGSGLAGAESQLVCAGAAVPLPDYAAYLRGEDAIPTTCAGGGTGSAVTGAPAVTAIADDFRAPRTYRANLGLTRRFWERWTASLDGSYTLGRAQSGARDVNLNTAGGFSLADEGGRPVFVPAAAIAPATGAAPLAASRVDPRFAQVFEVSSRQRSTNVQATAALNGFTSRGVAFNLSWTVARQRDQVSGGGFGGGFGGGGGGFGGPAQLFNGTPTAGNPNQLFFAPGAQDVRHNLIGTVTYPVHPSFEVTAVARATSGRPYTPIVQGDINGDGARNDAAFVFDPARTADPALAAQMQQLLDAAPSAARQCLTAQLGAVAGRNSCRGPWIPGLDMQLNYKPDRFGLRRRLTLSTLVVNPLVGLDQLLHGENNLRGWGQFAQPDPTLLAVRGFDQANQRYVYEVNQRFGNVRQAARAFRQTFQIGLQARFVFGQGGGFGGFGGGGFGGPGGGPGGGGPGGGGGGFGGGIGAILANPSQANSAEAQSAATEIAARANPAARLIELRDSLALDSAQVAKLEVVRDSVAARYTRFLGDVRAARARLGNNVDPAVLFSTLRPQLARGAQIVEAGLAESRAVLTEAQWAKVPADIKNPRRGFGGPGGGGPPGGRP